MGESNTCRVLALKLSSSEDKNFLKNSNSDHFLSTSLVAGTVLRDEYRLACGLLTSMEGDC